MSVLNEPSGPINVGLATSVISRLLRNSGVSVLDMTVPGTLTVTINLAESDPHVRAMLIRDLGDLLRQVTEARERARQDEIDGNL